MLEQSVAEVTNVAVGISIAIGELRRQIVEYVGKRQGREPVAFKSGANIFMQLLKQNQHHIKTDQT